MSAGGQMPEVGGATVGARPMPERIPRAVLTRRLKRLLARVDATPERVVERKKSLVFGIDVRGPVRVRVDAIWVFGSYARGAPECGDVDLIIQSHMEWAGPVTLDGRPYLGSRLLPGIGKVISPAIGPLRNITFVDHHNYMSGGTIARWRSSGSRCADSVETWPRLEICAVRHPSRPDRRTCAKEGVGHR
jgi:predicted nucleotidyltransferase